MDSIGDPTDMEVSRVTFYPDNVRAIHNIIDDTTIYERKVPRSDISSTYYRYVSSEEIPVTDIPTTPTGTYAYRLRFIYQRWLGTYDLHITFRTTVGDRITQSISIEVETPTVLDRATIASLARRLMTMHNGWDIPDPARTISSMKRNLQTMGLRQIQRPYDLTWKGFTYDNLVDTPTAISFKADGVRRFLCLSPVGTFMVTANSDIIPLNLQAGTPTLIDGELMGSTYYAFDILYHDGTSYQDSPYDTRHNILSTVAPSQIATNIGSMTIRVKDIIIPTSASEFFEAVATMANVPIDTDGLILTPVAQPYRDPVYKWKPIDMLTVDFFIGRDNTLYTFDTGTLRIHPELSVSNPDATRIGTIGEFRRIGDNLWEQVRQRWDKATPNSERVYEAIVSLLSDPITYDSMVGQSLKPMRKYHNRVKGKVYNYLANQGVLTLTDIGAGRGGDLSKWKSNGLSVIAVEPDTQNIYGDGGLLARARDMGATIDRGTSITYIYGEGWDVTLYPVSAQDYEAYQDTEAITLFNVATFLSAEEIASLGDDTESEWMVLMVMDGTCLQAKFLQPEGSYHSDLIDMEALEGDRVRIQLHDSSTVTRAQVERLVDPNHLQDTLQGDGWATITDTYLTGEKLLGEEGSAYSSCQRLMIMKRVRVGDIIVRDIYTPLSVGTIEAIPDTPWGPLVRVGVPSTGSFRHAILQATDDRYRSLDTISKVLYTGTPSPGTKVYMIPRNSWDIYSQEYRYPALGGIAIDREPGIVLMYNQGQWEPLARRDMEGNLQYVW